MKHIKNIELNMEICAKEHVSSIITYACSMHVYVFVHVIRTEAMVHIILFTNVFYKVMIIIY